MSPTPARIDFYTAADGCRLAARVWEAAGSPRSRVVFVHGITSHSGWYHRSCEHLAAAGHEVHFLDRRGSGLNGHQGADVDQWQTWLDDVAGYLRGLPSDRPASLLGISWGGKLAVAVARKYPGIVRGLGLICPGLYSRHYPALWKRLALAAMPARFHKRLVPVPLRSPALFTDNPAGREFIANDPLALRDITLRLAREDRQLGQFACSAATFIHVPLLVMLAGRDRIVDNQRTRDFFGRVPGSHKTLIEYSAAAHTLEFEPDPQQYFRDLVNWLDAAVVGCPSSGC